MSSQVRLSAFVFLVALSLTTQVRADSISADLSSAKLVGVSLRAYSVANPESKDVILSNMNWTKTRITESKKFLGSKNLSHSMKLKVAQDSYKLLLNASVRLSKSVTDADLKNAAMSRLVGFKKVVDSKNLGEIYKAVSAMELEIASIIEAYTAI